jgi:phosphopantothenoylcysteine synthetase/decarboxylase
MIGCFVLSHLSQEEPAMSERALAFVEEWVSDHIRAGEHPQAKALARQCLADASAQGIPAGEIGESIDDLEEFMEGALEEANERKAHRAGEDDEEAEDDENGEEEDDEDDDEEDDDDDEDDGEEDDEGEEA